MPRPWTASEALLKHYPMNSDLIFPKFIIPIKSNMSIFKADGMEQTQITNPALSVILCVI